MGVNSIARVTVTSQGQQTNGNVTGAAMSGDGRYVVFASGASNIVNGDLNDKEDIFLRDLELGTTVLASITPPAAFLTTTASSPLSQRMAATSHTAMSAERSLPATRQTPTSF